MAKSKTVKAWQFRTFMRKRSADRLGLDARLNYCMLGKQQPLLLHREPDNPFDANAVRVSDLSGDDCGYIAREHAGEIASKLDSGLVILARTDGPCLCVIRKVLLWTDGELTETDIYSQAPMEPLAKAPRAPVRKPEKVE